MEENARQLCHDICSRIADVEVVEAYRNVRVSGVAETPDPPKTTNCHGEKFTTEMMSSGGSP